MGTLIANFFPTNSPVYVALSFNNDLVQEINEARTKIDIPIYHIVPKWDFMIVPTSAAKYTDTPEHRIYYYNGFLYSHCGIAYSLEVAQAICMWLI
jgi:hypothetical protein